MINYLTIVPFIIIGFLLYTKIDDRLTALEQANRAAMFKEPVVELRP